jgi:hypothetical protein
MSDILGERYFDKLIQQGDPATLNRFGSKDCSRFDRRIDGSIISEWDKQKRNHSTKGTRER